MTGVEANTDLLGHPRGLMVLAATEMWERFSFFGMQALLMLYMTKYLLLPVHSHHVLGLSAYRSGLEAVSGPMTDLAFAAQTFGIYSGLVFGMPLIGAWLGDRVLGKTRAITLGCLLMSAGHLAMAIEALFLLALLLIVLGAGGVIGNMAAQVGQLYAPDDDRRTRAFGIYLITLNIGALAAPLVIGTLGERVGWHYGFGAAGVGMLFGLFTYHAGRRFLPPEKPRNDPATLRLTAGERTKVTAILLSFLPYILYNMAVYQAYGLMFVWADKAVDRVIFRWEMPVTWIGSVDGLLTILGVVVANRTWAALSAKGREPSDFEKMTLGYLGVGLAFLFAAAIAMMDVIPLLAWIVFYLILDFNLGWIEAPIKSMISREAPPSVTAMMMALMRASTMLGFFGLGWLARFYEPLGPSRYWVVTASLSLSASALMFVGRSRLKAMLHSPRAILGAW